MKLILPVLQRQFLLLSALHFFFNPLQGWAHPEGFSGLHVTIGSGTASAALTLHTRDLGTWLPPETHPDYVADACREMEQTVDEIVELQLNGAVVVPASAKAFLVETGLIEIDVNWRLPPSAKPAELLVWSKHLPVLPRGHQQLLFIEDRRQSTQNEGKGKLLLEDILTVDRDAGVAEISPDNRDDPVPESMQPEVSLDATTVALRQPAATPLSRVPLTASREEGPRRISFFFLGVEHILTGYDHLLFLAALLLTCASLFEAGKIITCFTVAHSMTLALAALDIVQLPAQIVEPAIAASIIYVAMENLWTTTPALWRRVTITFAFGLIHGLGFASVLRDVGLGTIPGGVVWPLLRFNLGVEVGQLCVATLFFLSLKIVSRNKSIHKKFVRGGSLLIALCGGYWLLVRSLPQVFGQ